MVDVILTRRAEFSVFTSYISNYDRRMAQLDESCEQHPGFSAIVTQYQVGPVTLCDNKDVFLEVEKYCIYICDFH